MDVQNTFPVFLCFYLKCLGHEPSARRKKLTFVLPSKSKSVRGMKESERKKRRGEEGRERGRKREREEEEKAVKDWREK